MKLYFLVEGISSEMQVYPEWVKLYLPNLEVHDDFDSFKCSDTGVYYISGEGYPSILNHIEHSVSDIKLSADVDYFFIVLDSDEDSIEAREEEVKVKLEMLELPERVNVCIVVQKRCFETILLGNRYVIPRQPNTEPLVSYMRYYNVNDEAPELMGAYNDGDTHSQFHAKYAIKALKERRVRYSKSNCSGVANLEYFEKVVERVHKDQHLKSLSPLINTLTEVREKLS